MVEILRPSTLGWELDTIVPLVGSPFPMYLQLMNLIFINDVYFSVDFFNVGVICCFLVLRLFLWKFEAFCVPFQI